MNEVADLASLLVMRRKNQEMRLHGHEPCRVFEHPFKPFFTQMRLGNEVTLPRIPYPITEIMSWLF